MVVIEFGCLTVTSTYQFQPASPWARHFLPLECPSPPEREGRMDAMRGHWQARGTVPGTAL